MATDRGMRRVIYLLLGLVVLGSWVLFQYFFAYSQQSTRHILILESNHATDPWTAGVKKGVEEAFFPVEEDFDLYFEYMDTKRHPGPEYISQVLEKALPFKLSPGHHDLVILSDNDAFDFGLRHRNDLFAGIPIVFCGVSDFKPSSIAGLKGITGVSEWHSYRGTISTALDLQPETKEIVVIGSTQTLKGRRSRQLLLNWAPMFEKRVRFTFWDDLPIEDLTERLKGLSEGSIVLLDSFVTFSAGHVLPSEKSLQLIRNASPVPIYSLWDFYLGKGIVGGKLISSRKQGQIAATMALRILEGENAEDIPVVSRDANEYMYDYGELKRFNLSMASLPETSLVVNQPPSFYEINKKYLWSGVALLVGLSAVIFVLLLNIVSRRAAERQLAIFRRFVEASSQGMGFGTLDGRILYMNPALCHMVGEKAPEGFVEKFMAEYYSDRCRESLLNDILPEVRRQGHWQGEMEIISRTGRRIPTLENICILPDEKGKPLYLGNVVTDIFHRKQAEAALRESEERYRSLVENIDLGISLVNADYRVVMVNAALARMNGKRAEELAGKNCFDVFAVCEKLKPDCPCKVVLKEGKPASKERWIQRPSGKRLIRLQAFPVSGSDKKISGFIGVFEDMTERARAEEEVKTALTEAEEARDKIATILRSVDDGIIVMDVEARVVLMNPALESILGVRLEEVFGQPVAVAIKETPLKDYLLEAATRDAAYISSDFELLDMNLGVKRVFQGHTSVVKNREGRRTGLVTLLQDVTRQRELDRMKNEFISTAAHELRTPLTSIMGYAELLAKPEEFGTVSSHDERECLNVIYEKGEELSRIIDDLLNLSRIQSGLHISLEKERGNICELINQSVSPYKQYSPKHQFEVVLLTSPVEMSFDRRKIGQVMENILSNAVKFSPSGGLIRVKGEVIENFFQVCVEDRGLGMSPEQIERVFDKFYRVDASDTAAQGLGLGMSIARDIVQAHGGKIWVVSALEKGTTVFFTLPLGYKKMLEIS